VETRQYISQKADTPTPPAHTKDEIKEPVSVAHVQPPASVTFKVPRAPQGYGKGVWVPFGESISIKNITISGGMIYVGTILEGEHGINEPCLIDPTKPVAQQGDYTVRQIGYWPSYSDISSTARRAYLNWLSDGRKDPAADIGFVFLFFYGLERRAFVDTISDKSTQEDLPIIAAELYRLLSIYGGKSNSFSGYAKEFLDWITLHSFPTRLYEQPLPVLSKSFQLPLQVRLALGQAAMDGKPVPPSLALGWVKLEPNITLRTPATRCPQEFDQLFQVKYTEFFHQGLVLPRNKTKLKFIYRPASAGLHARDSLVKVLDDVPDVTVLTAPIKKLQIVVEAVTKELEPFSKLVAKNPTARGTFEGLLRLPTSIWPESSYQKLLNLKERVGEGMLTMKYEDALYSLFEESSTSNDYIVALARTLESVGLGIEPNVLIGAKLQKLDDHIVIFAMPTSEAATSTDGPFLVAELTLQLASAVAAADGEFSIGETIHLREQVYSWVQLTQAQKRRLLAHVELLSFNPVSFTRLKKKIEKFTIDEREMIAESMARVALVDGDASPDSIRVLEKIYKVLDVSTSKVFSNLHGVASGSEASKPQATDTVGQVGSFILNRGLIAARQADTDKVQALLADIFSDADEPAAEIVQEAPHISTRPNSASSGLLLGLDQAHSTFLRRILVRHEWSREDLLHVAAELDLMLDGALEYINDAAYDAFNMPFIESNDPLVINPEILSMLIT
jgi:uncharacterized tellurite resistance protein B-like protein